MIKKLLNLFKRHIILTILCFIAFLALVVMLVAFLKMTINTSGKYGDRLDGIEKVEIKNSTLKDIEKKIKENSEVESTDVRVQGKIVYVDITFNHDTSMDKGKEIAKSTLDSFDEDEIKFYNFSFVLNSKDGEGEDNKGWNTAGSMNDGSKEIVWIKS